MALSVRPAPPEPTIIVPEGSRSGVFAATPEGHVGAAATPEVKASATSSTTNAGNGTSGAKSAANSLTGITISGGGSKPTSGVVVAGPATGDLRRMMATNIPP